MKSISIERFIRPKKLSFTFISLAVLLGITCVAAVASAQAPADTAESRLERLNSLRSGQTASSTERAEVREAAAVERQAALSARAQERLTNLTANLSNRADALAMRLTNIHNRLLSRIQKLEDQGVDTDAAEEAVMRAFDYIDAATLALADIDARVAAFTSDSDPKTAWSELRTTYTEIRANLQSAHSALQETIALLKAAVAAHESGNGVSDAVREGKPEEVPEEPVDPEVSETEETTNE